MFARIHNALLVRAAGYQAAREEGQTMAEYGLLLALIALAVIAAATLLGGAIDTQFRAVIAAL